MPIRHAEPTLIGRDNELSRLKSVLDRVADGCVAVAVVEGDAGIGKSRLVAEFIRTAGELGFPIFHARCEELEHRPFGVLLDALGCRRDSEDLSRRAIADLLDAADGGTEEVLRTQFRIVDSIATLVDALANRGPVVLAIEDLQWADGPTLVAIRAIVRTCARQPLAVVVDLRPFPSSSELDSLRRTLEAEDALHLRLGPLDDAAVAEMAAELLAAEPGPRLREQLTTAGGNPMFVAELIAALDEEGAITREAGKAEVQRRQVPPNLRLTIIRRMSFLPDATLTALRRAALLGTAFTLGDLATVASQPAMDLWGDLEPAARAGVLVENDDRLQFRHDLLREAVYEDIPLAARRGLHLEAARALAHADAPPGQVAEHFALGARRGDVEAVDWLVRAAHQSRSAAPSAAVRLYEQALALTERNDARRDVITEELLEPLMLVGRVDASVSLAREALRRTHPPELEARLRLGLAGIYRQLVRAEDAAEQVEAVLALPTTSPFDRLTLRTQLLLSRARSRPSVS